MCQYLYEVLSVHILCCFVCQYCVVLWGFACVCVMNGSGPGLGRPLLVGYHTLLVGYHTHQATTDGYHTLLGHCC